MTLGYTRTLRGDGATVPEVGGKAAGLDSLIGNGFQVPRAIAVTADTYRAVVDHAGLVTALDELRAEELPPPDRIEAETLRVESMFVAADVPPLIEIEIRSAAQHLLAEGPIAVRSSALSEDTAGASFAGQYLTVLNIKTEDEAMVAVRRCWASLWGPSVRAYRGRGDTSDQAMGVVLQLMAPAEVAGVMFTRDPLGDPGTIRIEMVEGLGEGLVSGAVTPEVYLIDRVSPGAEAEAPRFLEDLARVGVRVEQQLGAPQDVEWAWVNGHIYVLQARPITTSVVTRPDDDGFDTRPALGDAYTPAGVQEMLPGVLPPLLWSINAPMLDDAFRRLYDELGVQLPPTRGRFLALGRFRGRAALNLSVMRRAAASMPGGSADEVDKQYLGRVLEEFPQDLGEVERPRNGVSSALKSSRMRKRLESEVQIVADAADLLPVLGIEFSDLTLERMLGYWTWIRDLAWRTYAAEVTASASAAAAYRSLETMLTRWIGANDAALWAQQLTAGPAMQHQPGCNCAVSMWETYANGADEAALKTVLTDELESNETRHHTAALLHETMARVSRHFGSKSVYGGSTWDEDPDAVWNCLSVVVGNETADPGRTPADRQSRLAELKRSLRKSWKWKLTRILTGQLVDMRTRMLERTANDAAELLALREQAKNALMVLGGEERRLITEAARRLVAAGQLDEQQDVYLLSASELEAALRSGETISDYVLAARRNALAEAGAGDALPEAFEGNPGSAAPPPSADTDRLEGWAASAGVATGRAVVISRLEEGTRLSEGDILVTRSTDPSWTGLLLKAGGIVLEEGGPLSHAAIVAREFGVPAVLNVKGATAIIADGGTITVDGTVGIVDRSRPDPEPQDSIPEPQVIDGGELGVFIPGLMGAGILISILLVLADGARKIIPSSGDRKRAEIALGVYGIVSGAAYVAGRGVSPSARPQHGLRSRWAFALLAAASIAVGILAIRGGIDIHQSQGTLEGNGWPLAAGIGLAAAAFLFAIPAILVSLLYNRIPDPVRRIVASTAMGRLRPPPDDYAERARRLVPALEEGGP